MREIKFRVYDIDSKRMISNDRLVRHYLYGLITNQEENYRVMQYTGLKDKNDVEIYEGDMVKYDDGEYSYIGIVKNDLFYFYVDGIEPNDSFDFLDVSDTSTGTAELTVIGNVYENQELLNGGSERCLV